jgi:hypothetical protein
MFGARLLRVCRGVPLYKQIGLYYSRAVFFGKAQARDSADSVKEKIVVPQSFLEAGIVFFFCAVFALLVIQFASRTSATWDETVHLPAGYSYLAWNDYRMNPEHPPLVKKLAALPLLTFNLWPSDIQLRKQDAQPQPVTDSERAIRHAWAGGLDQIDMQWYFGHSFLYGVRPEAQQRFGASTPLLVPTTAALEKKDFLNDADSLVFWGRMPVLLLGISLAVLVFLWSREMFGLAGGVLSLSLFCFDPNFIAHSGLVTTDVGVTLFMFGTVYFLWRLCRRIEVMSVVLFLIFFGLAFVTKFSAALLVPIFWLAVLGRMICPYEWPVGTKGRMTLATFSARLAVLSGLFVAASLSAFIMIWASYGFRYSAAADPEQAAKAESQVLPLGPVTSLGTGEQKQPSGGAPQDRDRTKENTAPQPEVSLMPWREPGHLPIEAVVRNTARTEVLLKQWPDGHFPENQTIEKMPAAPLGLIGRGILFAKKNKLLPEAFLYGFAYVRMASLRRASFLLGEYSNVGFRSYFFWTFLLKTTLPALLAIVAGVVCALMRKVPWQSRMAFIIVPIGVYLIMSMVNRISIGHRHLLPVYPFLYVLAGGLALEWAKVGKGRHPQIIAAIALLAIPASCLFVFSPPWRPVPVHPNYLAYFNELGGGPLNGYKYLVDSNLDWGQDLKQLKAWLEKRNVKQPIYFCYFGMADPRYHGIACYNMGGGYLFAPRQPLNLLRPGCLIAISATNMEGALYNEQGRNAWLQILARSKFVDTVGCSIFIYEFQSDIFTSRPQ